MFYVSNGSNFRFVGKKMPSEVLSRALDDLAVQFIPQRLRYKTSNDTIEYQAERQGEW